MQERNTLGIEELLKPGAPAIEDEQRLNTEIAENEIPPLVYTPDDQGAQRGIAHGANDGAAQLHDNDEEESDPLNLKMKIRRKMK